MGPQGPDPVPRDHQRLDGQHREAPDHGGLRYTLSYVHCLINGLILFTRCAGISKSSNNFEKDKTLVASVSADGSLALWDVEARRPVLHAPAALYVRHVLNEMAVFLHV